MRPHDSLVKNFWLHVILTRIWDSAMSRSYAHFWSLFSWDHSSRHELDPVSRIPVANGQFLRSRLRRQYRDCAQLTGSAVSHSHVLGWWHVRTCPTRVPVTWESRVTSSITLKLHVLAKIPWLKEVNWEFDLAWSAKLQVCRSVILLDVYRLGVTSWVFFATSGLRKDFWGHLDHCG